MRPKKLILTTAIALLALTLFTGYAAADSISYYLDYNNGNNDTLYGGGNYGTVTVSLTTAGASGVGTAIITFSNATNLGYYSSGNTGLVAVNANGGNATVSNISVTGGSGTPVITAYQNTQFDSLSNPFSNVLKDTQSNFSPGFSTVSFTLLNKSTTSWTSASNVLAENGAYPYDHFIGAQILISGATTLYTDSAPLDSPGTSGFVSDPPSSVPEPCTMLLLGSGLVGVAAFRKFRKA